MPVAVGRDDSYGYDFFQRKAEVCVAPERNANPEGFSRREHVHRIRRQVRVEERLRFSRMSLAKRRVTLGLRREALSREREIQAAESDVADEPLAQTANVGVVGDAAAEKLRNTRTSARTLTVVDVSERTHFVKRLCRIFRSGRNLERCLFRRLPCRLAFRWSLVHER